MYLLSTAASTLVYLLHFLYYFRQFVECAPQLYGKKFDSTFETHDDLFRQAEDFHRVKDEKRRRVQAQAHSKRARFRRLDGENDEVFDAFVAHKDAMTCTADEHINPFDEQVRGVCLGGWQVLEPWITPSLFYQFLGGNSTTTAIDTYTFCEILGAEEGNKQLRRHWDTWVTEDIVRDLAMNKNINSFRLPVGDWSFVSYGPYIGCTDGSLDYIDKLLDWAEKYGVSVLFDIHAMKDSQNGFDNSGQARTVEWTSKFSRWPDGEIQTFLHWPLREANWMGEFDRKTLTYPNIDRYNINHGLDVISKIVDRYYNHSSIFGLEPINEPWEFTPEEELKRFYFDGYLIVKRRAPKWKYVMHDSFRFDVSIWGGFMDGCPDRALDTHIYQAWKTPNSKELYYQNACEWKRAIGEMERAFGPVIVGEWSLATDNCAMYLNGFNDNLPGYPMLPCKYVQCPEPYMGTDQPGTPLDPGLYLQGPYGTGVSGPSYGFCPVGRDWYTNDRDNSIDWKHAPPEAPPGRDGTDEVMTNLARKKISAFSGVGHGYYFWNFRTELPEYGWSYLLASERGWIPTGKLYLDDVFDACIQEDNFEYNCLSIREEDNERFVRDNVIGILHNASITLDGVDVDDLTGTALYDEADQLYNQYWRNNSLSGTTCDFGGTAQLTISTSAASAANSQINDYITYNEGSVSFRTLIYGVLGGLAVGCCIGFVIVMKTSLSFNTSIRQALVPRRFKNSAIFTSHGSLLGNESMPILADSNDTSVDLPMRR